MLDCQVSIKNYLKKNKHLLVENELKKLKTFDSSYFISKSHFIDGTQNYLVFHPMCRYFNQISDIGSGNYIYSQKSKGLFDGNITAPTRKD